MRLARVIVASLVLAITGCGARAVESQGPNEQDPLRGRTFLSTEVTEAGKPLALLPRTRVSLTFTDDGRLLANAGCNTLTGQVTTGGGVIGVGDGLAQTDLGCEPKRLQQDTWLSKVLNNKPTWRLDGTRLVLRSQETELVLLDREVADPDRPLAGTTWAVDTLVDGQVAGSTPAAATATLRFGKDEVKIFAGCNSGSAGYTPTGDTIRFADAAMTRMACPPDIMRLEAAVLGVLRGEVTVRIQADRLTLTTPSGKGIQLRAQ